MSSINCMHDRADAGVSQLPLSVVQHCYSTVLSKNIGLNCNYSRDLATQADDVDDVNQTLCVAVAHLCRITGS